MKHERGVRALAVVRQQRHVCRGQGSWSAVDVPDFTDRGKAEAWLRDQPREWSLAIAARAALRMLPSLHWLGEHIYPALYQRDIVLPLLRGTILPWVAVHGLTQGRELSAAAVAAAHLAADVASDALNRAGDLVAASDGAYRVGDLAAAAGAYRAALAASSAFSSASSSFAAARASTAADAAATSAADATAACAADASALIASGPALLMSKPLWSASGEPAWARSIRHDFRIGLLTRGEHWRPWLGWLDAVTEGRAPWGLPAAAVERVLVTALNWPEEEWKRGPDHINPKLAALVEAERGRVRHPEDEKTEEVVPSTIPIPKQRPAAIEPIWDRDRLIPVPLPAPAELDPATLQAALTSLKSSLATLAEDAAAEQNIDKRAVRRLDRLAGQIGDTLPAQASLFTLAHGVVALREYLSSVEAEWPDILASDYRAVLKQFEQTVRQFPRWREFIRNAEKDTLEGEDIENVLKAGEEFEQAGRAEPLSATISSSIADVFRDLLASLPTTEERDEVERTLTAAKEEIALDVLESLDNIAKRLAERLQEQMAASAALAAKLKDLARQFWNHPIFVKGRERFVRRLDKSFPQGMDKLADMVGKHGPIAAVLVTLLVVAKLLGFGTAAVGAAGGVFGVSRLRKKLKWLDEFLKSMGL